MERQCFRADRTLPPRISGINAAGLLAVLAVLLVFFMLWTPNHEWGPDLPAAENALIQPNPSWGTLFTITRTGAVYVDRRPVSPVSKDELDERVRSGCEPSMRFIGSDHALYIEADPELSYAVVLEILARCRAHGGDRAVFLTRRNVSIVEAWAFGFMPSPSEWRRALEEQENRFLH